MPPDIALRDHMAAYRKQIVFLEHESVVLRDNPLGDPFLRELPVYLPPTYDADPRSRFPIIWVLAPFTGWGEKLFNLSAWDENVVQRADRLMRNEAMSPTILAFPDAFTRFGGSQYLNSSAVGPYHDYIIEELVPFVDQSLRTMPEGANRAVMGHSSGGYGALMFAMLRPDIFAAAASHAGDMFFETCYWPDIPGAVRALSHYENIEAFVGELTSLTHTRDVGRDWFNALGLCAMSACYSPNPASKTGFDLPFDPYTGEIKHKVWELWLEHDPVRATVGRLENLRKLKMLYFDCGINDEYNLFLGARRLHRLLEQAAIDHLYEEFEGTHRNMNWRYERSLPILANAIAP
jgi:enterochelin esterase-like enzyme